MRWIAILVTGSMLGGIGCFPEPLPPDCVDTDGDGFGDPAYFMGGCETDLPDCDDSDPAAHPGDNDGDGYSTCGEDGLPGTGDEDCVDTDDSVHPGAAEACNEVDDDCNGEVDDGLDGDGDGYTVCEDGVDGGDCDDADPDIHPGAEEICNDGVDDDCDPGTGENADLDADGYTICDGDCDDLDMLAGPAAGETCGDSIDNDCDGTVDEGECLTCTSHLSPGTGVIQVAIENATTGDVLCLAPGAYTDNLDFGGRAITVVGLGGPRSTSVDGGGAGSVAAFVSGEGGSSVLAGLTLTHGTGEIDALHGKRGGGIVADASSPSLSNLVVSGNEVEAGVLTASGGGIYLLDSSATVANVLVEGNSVTTTARDASGGGLYLENSGATLIHVAVVANSAQDVGTDAGDVRGGGIYLASSFPDLRNVTVSENLAEDEGGGIFVDGGSLQLANVAITGNSVTSASGGKGGGLAALDAAVQLTNVTVLDNASTLDCGGLYLEGSADGLVNVAVHGNSAAGNGGGICLAGGIELNLTNVSATSNVASDGSNVHCDGCSPDWQSCNLWSADGIGISGISYSVGSDGNLSVDPTYLDTTDADSLLWDLHLATDSPLADVGDGEDPDGSGADIGAYGGTGADLWDLDGDEYPEWWQPGEYDFDTYPDEGWDCDDRDAGVYPGRGC